MRAGRRWREFLDADGATGIDARLAPDDYAAVSAVLDRFQRDVFRQARQSGRRDSPDAYRLDAFVAAMTAAGAATGLTSPAATTGPTGTANPTGAGAGAGAGAANDSTVRVARPPSGGRVGVSSVVVLVDALALRRGHCQAGERCEVPGVGPVSVAWAHRLLGDALVEVLVHDGVDITTYASTTRTVPRSIRTALSIRDQTCVVPGCDRRRGLQIDHRHPYAKGGPTTWDNLNLLCEHHHDHKTHRGARLERHDDQWMWWPPPTPTTPTGPSPPPAPRPANTSTGGPPPTNPHSPTPPPTPPPARRATPTSAPTRSGTGIEPEPAQARGPARPAVPGAPRSGRTRARPAGRESDDPAGRISPGGDPRARITVRGPPRDDAREPTARHPIEGEPMPEAVIVATARSPIGRAAKGSLVDVRPDDLGATIVRAVLDKVPQLDPQSVEDLIMGCGQPGGESGYNLGRVVAVLAGLPDVPGVTVNRYCSSSLQTIRMAAHAIKAGEGDVFLSAGVETVSRYINGASDTGPHNPLFAEAEARTALRTAGGQPDWTPPEGLPDVYIAMGQTAENVAEFEHVSRQEMDEFAALSQQRATAAQERGFFEAEITPVTTPDGTVVSKDDGIRPGTTAEGLAGLKPVFRPDGVITAGNACPLNDGAAAVVVMSDTRAAELGIKPLARVVASGVSGLNPEIMGLGPVTAIRQTLDRAGMTMSDIDLVEINEAFAAQVIPSAKHLDIPWEKLNVNGGAIALGHPVRHDRRPHHDHAPAQPRGHRQDHRPREHVRGRWPGHGHDRRAPVALSNPTGGGSGAMSEISVVVPARDRAGTLGRQLSALVGQEVDEPFQVLVVDNGSTDATADIARSFGDRLEHLELIEAPGARGAAGARNVGAHRAAGDLLALCDSDDVVRPGWLRALTAPLRKTSAVVAGRSLPLDEGEPTPPRGRGTSASPRPRFLDFLPFADTCNMAIRRDDLLALGGFDPRFRRCSDVELSWRAQLAGLPLVDAPDAEVLKYSAPRALRTVAAALPVGTPPRPALRPLPRPRHAGAPDPPGARRLGQARGPHPAGRPPPPSAPCW